MRLRVIVSFTFILNSWIPLANSAQATLCSPQTVTQAAIQKQTETPLPERTGPRIRTSGSVPHVQVDVVPVAALNETLRKVAFTLPGVEERPTIVSLPGTIGMWLGKDVHVVNQKAIVSGREFAHIHTDGSLHAPLPLKRAQELHRKGWGERHPWADRRDGWEGLVMLYSVSTEEELTTLVQLIAESYNYVTGKSIQITGC